MGAGTRWNSPQAISITPVGVVAAQPGALYVCVAAVLSIRCCTVDSARLALAWFHHAGDDAGFLGNFPGPCHGHSLCLCLGHLGGMAPWFQGVLHLWLPVRRLLCPR